MSFPKVIKMKGLPLNLSGWNNTYRMTEEISDGCPVYHMYPYCLYYFLNISGTKIYRDNGIWKLKLEDALCATIIQKYGTSYQSDPFGYWSLGGFVEPEY